MLLAAGVQHGPPPRTVYADEYWPQAKSTAGGGKEEGEDRLPPRDRMEIISIIIAARTFPDRGRAAEIWAASLPQASKCPF